MADYTRSEGDSAIATGTLVKVHVACRAEAGIVVGTDVPFRQLLIRGHSATGVGYKLSTVEQIESQEIEAGDTWTLTLEDYFTSFYMCGASVSFHNVQGYDLHLLVTQVVNGVSNILVNETIAGHGALALKLHSPALRGLRLTDTVANKKHRVVWTNNETTRSALAAVVICGWSSTPTTLPVSNV